MGNNQTQDVQKDALGTSASDQQTAAASDQGAVPGQDQSLPGAMAQATTPDPNAQQTHEDQVERTRLGRKVADLERNINAFISEIRATRAAQLPQQPQPSTDEVVATVGDVLRVMEQREAEKDRARTVANERYANDFLQEVARIGIEDPQLHAEVTHEMFEVPNSLFNQRRTDNGVVDANWNYQRAMKAVLTRKYANPARQQAPGEPRSTAINTGISMGTRTVTTQAQNVQLDEHARDFINRTGRGSEWASKALSAKED